MSRGQIRHTAIFAIVLWPTAASVAFWGGPLLGCDVTKPHDCCCHARVRDAVVAKEPSASCPHCVGRVSFESASRPGRNVFDRATCDCVAESADTPFDVSREMRYRPFGPTASTVAVAVTPRFVVTKRIAHARPPPGGGSGLSIAYCRWLC